MPFHFGYWDNPDRARAANELTLFEWDAVSKQPHFKYAAVKLKKVSKPSLSQPETVELHPEDHPASSMTHLAEQASELARMSLRASRRDLSQSVPISPTTLGFSTRAKSG